MVAPFAAVARLLVAAERRHEVARRVVDDHLTSTYVDLMRNLKLSRPTQMDAAVAANLACGESVKDRQ
jgi:hypothetical protein